MGTGGLLLGAGITDSIGVGKAVTGMLLVGAGGSDDWSDRVQKLTSSAPISNSCVIGSFRCLDLYLFI